MYPRKNDKGVGDRKNRRKKPQTADRLHPSSRLQNMPTPPLSRQPRDNARHELLGRVFIPTGAPGVLSCAMAT